MTESPKAATHVSHRPRLTLFRCCGEPYKPSTSRARMLLPSNSRLCIVFHYPLVLLVMSTASRPRVTDPTRARGSRTYSTRAEELREGECQISNDPNVQLCHVVAFNSFPTLVSALPMLKNWSATNIQSAHFSGVVLELCIQHVKCELISESDAP